MIDILQKPILANEIEWKNINNKEKTDKKADFIETLISDE